MSHTWVISQRVASLSVHAQVATEILLPVNHLMREPCSRSRGAEFHPNLRITETSCLHDESG